MTLIFRNWTIFWDISKWNRGQTKWDGGSIYFSATINAIEIRLKLLGLRVRNALPKRMFCVSSVFFFFFEPKYLTFSVNSAWCAMFTDPQISLFSNFFIKNKSHDTIHTFKNYFAIVFFSFQFLIVSKRTLKLKYIQIALISNMLLHKKTNDLYMRKLTTIWWYASLPLWRNSLASPTIEFKR